MGITDSDVKKLASDRSYDRGLELYEAESVTKMEKRGNTLTGHVYGSAHEPYRVKVELDGEKIVSTHCTCPYDWGGICKHTVALLFHYMQRPEQVVARASMDELLKGLNEAELRHILMDLLESNPHLANSIEITITGFKAPAIKPIFPLDKKSSKFIETQSSTVDVTVFKRKAQDIIQHAENWQDRYGYYYDDEGDDEGLWESVNDFMELFNGARPWLDAGDGQNALLILDAVMDSFIFWCTDLEEFIDLEDTLDKINTLFAESFLSVSLSQEEREQWEETLHGWEDMISGMGFDVLCAEPMITLWQAWEYPLLQDILKGKTSDKIDWEYNPDDYDLDEEHLVDYDIDLTSIYLNVLEQQGRDQEFLNLAKAQEEFIRYVSMLVKLDRNHEAMAAALEHFKTAAEAEKISGMLYDKGMRENALKIATHGLSLEGTKYNIARWLRDEAAKDDSKDLALKAAKVAFVETFLFDDYLALKRLAGTSWDAMKSEFLLHPDNNIFSDVIKIYLNEGMLKEAMAFIDKDRYCSFSSTKKVVDAVYKQFPDWAILQCKRQGEPSMNQGKSKYYEYSVRWVERAGRAYLAAGRQKKWNDYLEGLIKKHHRKYSLRPRLEALRALD